jgi:chromosome segregation ATPase
MPGVNLPPVIALISLHKSRLVLRKLAPLLPVLVNGESATVRELRSGDVIGLGPVEVRVHLEGTPEIIPPMPDGSERERALRAEEAALAQRRAELDALARKLPSQLSAREQELARQEAELTATRRELAQLRSQFADRFQERRDKLLSRQQAVHRAARKLAQRKRQVEARETAVHTLGEETARARAEVLATAEKNSRDKAYIEEQIKIISIRQAELEHRETALAQAQADLEAGQKHHHNELVRLDRIQAGIDQRQRALEQRHLELDGREAALHTELQAATAERDRLHAWQEQLATEARELQTQREEHDARESDLARRSAAVEAQQTMLGTLRGRLEALRDDLRRQEQDLADQRIMHEAAVEEQTRRAQEIERLHGEVMAERESLEAEQQQFAQQRATLEQAVAQLRQARDSLDAEQRALDERTAELDALVQTAGEVESARTQLAALQQQLAERQSALEQAERSASLRQAELDAHAMELERRESQWSHQLHASEELETLRSELREQAVALAQREQAIDSREQTLQAEVASYRAAAEADGQLREELAALKQALPEMEARASAALANLRAAQEQAHAQLVAQEERFADAERLRVQELELGVARDEHRVAVESFRQQLQEWQSKLAQMRQGEANAAPPASVAAPAPPTEVQELVRRKLRDQAQESDYVPLSVVPPATAAPPETSGGDGSLEQVLRKHALIDTDVLQTLLGESRRQRRSLRQLLLSGGHLTLYQLALIEAGNLEALALGPVQVIDKIPSTPREAVYRVFDPRHDSEAILRHLAESEMGDAVRPDEFRSRFAAAQSVEHGNVAAVREVLEIHGRPAALLEWVNGLPSGDWPGLAAAPGAWFRLVCQAALALHAAHEQGVAHGHLEAQAFVLTEDGTLKLMGLGEPLWLTNGTVSEETPQGDLKALGTIVAGWAATPPGGKAVKAKPLPEELAKLIDRMRNGEFPSAKDLIEELDRVSVRVPASGTAWERLLKYVAEQTQEAHAA